MHGTIQMKLYMATIKYSTMQGITLNIRQTAANPYSEQTFIFLSASICSNRAVSYMCIPYIWHDVLHYSNRVLIYYKYFRSYWIILTEI